LFYQSPARNFIVKTHILGSLEAQRRARRGHKTIHSSNAMSGKKDRTRKEKRERGRDANAGEAFARLPNHLVVTHVLRPEYFDDPADLARLPAVSRAMRDLVAETGLRFKELDEKRAVELGCVSALQRMQRQGQLSRQELLCQAAARSGQLAELKVLRAGGWPWDRETCSAAALGGHLEVLQWARANGCPWDIRTCHKAAEGGHLKVLLGARANGCQTDENELHIAALNGQVAMVRALMELGADVNTAGDGDATPLYVAAQNGHKSIVRALMELGADVNQARDDGVTPLYIAAEKGYDTLVRALIELGADINKARNTGATPLYDAAYNGHEAIVRALTESGADVNKATDKGWTPLAIAAQEGHEAIVRALPSRARTSTRRWMTARRAVHSRSKGPHGDCSDSQGCRIGPDAAFIFVNTRRTIL
jgi:hypothetical protein